jgi:MoxR-like ATPase
MASTNHTIACLVPGCGESVTDWLGDHLVEVHGLAVDSYEAQHPGTPVMSKRLKARHDKATASTRRAHPPNPDDMTVEFAGLQFKLNAGVPASACLPLPNHYELPRFGELGKDIANALVSLFMLRSMYIWGLPGTGKDALFHAFSALTRTPAIIKQVIPGSDIEAWFFSRGFNESGTHWEEGDVLKALRDGYVCEDGTVVPYMLLCSDLDRADRSQAEYLRLITDSIQGRVSGPTGTVYTLLKGTRVVATANTAGSGDERGRMVSANPIDASILDRFERTYEFHLMDWRDEEPIVRAKHPILVARAPWVFGKMGKATKALRAAIAGEDLYAEFSHRGLCAILGHAQDLLVCSGPTHKVPASLLRKAARAWWDGLPDKEARDKARTVMDAHLKGGAVNEGNTGHISNDPLADLG